MDKIKECIDSGLTCDRSRLGCFNTTLKDQGKCTKCLIQLLEEHDKEVINKTLDNVLKLIEDHKTKGYVTGITNNAFEFGACQMADELIKLIEQLKQLN